jgi:signal transduction histidine kinase
MGMSLLAELSFEWPVRLGRRATAARETARGAVPSVPSTPTPPSIESALFAALLAQEHLGVGVCGHDGVLTMVDPALERMLGAKHVQAGQSSGLLAFDLHDEVGRPLRMEQDPLARALRGESVTAQMVTVRRSGQPVRFIRCSAFQLRDCASEVLAAVVLAVDVTDSMAEQHMLDELRDRLVAAVNHEVRTPLAVISGHMELITDHVAPLPEDLAWSLGAIDRATGHLGDVVNTISEIADQSMAMGPH